MIKLRNLVLFELLSILFLCTAIGANLFITGLSSFWRDRFTSDTALFRQAFYEHRDELRAGNTAPFESTLKTIGTASKINELEVEYRRGKVVRLASVAGDNTAFQERECHKPGVRAMFTGNVCFESQFYRGEKVTRTPLATIRWSVLPDGLEAQKRAALMIFIAVLLFGLMLTALHWLLIRRVILQPISKAVDRFDHWVRDGKELAIPESRYKACEITDLIRHFDMLLHIAENFRNVRERAIQLSATEEVARQVSHDLRSPLSALRVAVDRLTMNPSHEAHALAQTALQRLNEILSTLNRTAHRAQSDQARVESVCSLVRAIVDEHRSHVDPSRVEIVLDCDENLGAFSCVDGASVRRAISNVLTNAIEALPDGRGTVRVHIAHDNGFVRIEVKDTGVGIPAEVLHHLGRRGVTFGKTGESGSGLGVYQAMCAIKACQGTLQFKSTPGLGTTVEIRLPEAPAPA